jgi:hypothetical protein
MPRTFTDNAGRSWQIAVTVSTIRRVRAEAGVDLAAAGRTAPGGESVLERIASDPVLLADALYAIVRPEAEARKITPEQFGEALAGDAVEAAADALVEEIVDFFPTPVRARWRRAMDLAKAARSRNEAQVDRELERMAEGAAAETPSPSMPSAPPAASPAPPA